MTSVCRWNPFSCFCPFPWTNTVWVSRHRIYLSLMFPSFQRDFQFFKRTFIQIPNYNPSLNYFSPLTLLQMEHSPPQAHTHTHTLSHGQLTCFMTVHLIIFHSVHPLKPKHSVSIFRSDVNCCSTVAQAAERMFWCKAQQNVLPMCDFSCLFSHVTCSFRFCFFPHRFTC